MGSRDGRTALGQPVVEATVEDDETPTEVVVSAVAAVSNVEAMDLPPLYEAIDPDALDHIFPDDTDDGCVRFRYHEYLVVVTADDAVEVYERDG